MVIAGSWAGWVVYRGCSVVFRAVPVLAPLPGISVHIVEPEGIGLELSHGSREHVSVAGFDRVFLTREFRLERRIGYVANLG